MSDKYNKNNKDGKENIDYKKYDEEFDNMYKQEDKRGKFRKAVDKDVNRRNKVAGRIKDKYEDRLDREYGSQRDDFENTKGRTNKGMSDLLEESLQDDGTKYKQKRKKEKSSLKGAGQLDKGDKTGLAKEIWEFGKGKNSQNMAKDEEIDRKMGKLSQTLSEYERNKDNPNSQQEYMKKIRNSIEADLSKAVEREKAEFMAYKAANKERVTHKDLERIEKKHKRAKAKNMSKDAISVIREVRSEENRQEFKAFMNSKEMRLLLGLVSFLGGPVGKAWVYGIKLFAFIWGLNFMTVFLVVVTLLLTTFFVLLSAVFMIIILDDNTLEDLGDGTEIVEDGEGGAETSGNVEVPKGYEGKIMVPLDKSATTSRGMGEGHRGWDAYASGNPATYPMYPGTVVHSGKGKPQCPHVTTMGDSCSTFDPSRACMNGDGNSVVVMSKIEGKNVLHYYMHMKGGSIVVDEGQKVGYGTKLGDMGSTGNSSGDHMHLEIWDDTADYPPGVAPCTVGASWNSAKTIAPQPLMTCGGKSGVMSNNPGIISNYGNIPQSCIDDANKARTK